MSKLVFDNLGRFVGVKKEDGNDEDNFEDLKYPERKLQTSDSLSFLRPEKGDSPKMENIFEKSYWSLYENTSFLKPLKFSNGKTQEDIVKEIYSLIEEGNKIIFLHGACGTGKSAIALNVARLVGKSSIVVPVKTLQTQYEKDYSGKMYVVKPSGNKMKIAMITGRENHDSIIRPGVSCADPTLPDTIKITERNSKQIRGYYQENPFIQSKDFGDISKLRRISIAPANPHWSPIIRSDYEIKHLTDSKKYEYVGCDKKKYVFYHRKPGCSYYDQYLSYKKSDAIIFNSAKYNSEIAIGRKPLTEVDIIDEADIFLDSFFEQSDLNLSWLAKSLVSLGVEKSSEEAVNDIIRLISLEEKNKRAIGVDESKIFKIEETNLKKIFTILNSNLELQAEISLDELNYANKALEVARNFSEDSEGVYLTYRKEDENLFVKIVSTNLSYKIKDLLSKTKTLVLMTGTLHSKKVLEHIFKIKDYKVVEAEMMHPGNIEIIKTGKEIDCRYSNFISGRYSREDYLESLSECVERSVDPTLIHVQAFNDLPSIDERKKFILHNLISKEDLIHNQRQDKFGREIENFKKGKFPNLFSTKCGRGVDFPGEICNSIIFTKFPNPNVKDIFWKVIKQTHPEYYWEFYKDKAKREFLQKVYRALRSKEDHVFILSPDSRVLDEVRALQIKNK
ncbi:MAG: helicase C-terminal domain-containing protein [Candidatus Pacearchaeota archaeon]